MGTNYYAKIKDNCPTCGEGAKTVHLGKSSMGWTFTFQLNGGKFYKNVQEMKKWLEGKEIKDEYGDVISPEDFWKKVEDKQKRKMSSVDLIIDGYSFLDCEFS